MSQCWSSTQLRPQARLSRLLAAVCSGTSSAERKREKITQRAASYAAGIEKLKNGFAGRLAEALRDNAPGKLRQLKAAYKTGADRHDGAAMWLAIKAMKDRAGPTQSRSAEWHEKQYERMRDESLADHCGVQDYQAKVVTLMEVHRPNFVNIVLNGTQLSDVYIKFLPSVNAQEGRTLRREVLRDGERRAERRSKAPPR